MDNLIKRLSNLLSVKSIVTITLTAVLALTAMGSFIDREGIYGYCVSQDGVFCFVSSNGLDLPFFEDYTYYWFAIAPQKNRFNNKYLYFNYFYSRKR